MGRQEEVVRGVLASTVNNAELDGADREGVQVPPPLSGQLGAARAAAARPRPVAPSDMPLSFGSIIARNVVPWRGVRTRPELLYELSDGVRSARTVGELQSGLQSFSDALLSTGVYKSVAFHLEPTSSGHTSQSAVGARTPDSNLIVELDELAFSVSSGVAQTLNGRMQMGTSVDVMNPFGFGEHVTASFGGSAPDLSLHHMTEVFSTPGGDGVHTPNTSTLQKAKGLLAPQFTLAFQKPTFLGKRTPLALRMRAEVDKPEPASGYLNKLQEVEATLTDTTNRHSIGYTCAWRNPVLLPHPSRAFASASSPLVVAECAPSIKSALVYNYNKSTCNKGGLPAHGTRVAVQTEVAGLGGDVQHVKVQASLLAAASFGRYAPDTGFKPALSRSQWLEAMTAGVDQGRPLMGESGQVLRAHPLDARVLPQLGGAAALEYGMKERLSAWASSGATVIAEAVLGAMSTYGTDARARAGAAPRIMDRFLLTSTRLRGFDSVGPRAAPVDHGTPGGDLLGGSALAAITTRVLLPPPIPSVRLANAGMRTQLFATAGLLLPSVTHLPRVTPSSIAASVGAGVVLPIMDGVSLEANYALWHHRGAQDVGAHFQFQMMA